MPSPSIRRSCFGPTSATDEVIALCARLQITLPPNSGHWRSGGRIMFEIPSLNAAGEHLATNGVLSIVQVEREPAKPGFYHRHSMVEIKPDNQMDEDGEDESDLSDLPTIVKPRKSRLSAVMQDLLASLP